MPGVVLCGGRLLVALALQPLAHQLAGPADGLGAFAGAALGRLLVVAAELHLAEDPFALHLLLQDAQRLIDVVFTDENLHFDRFLPCVLRRPGSRSGGNSEVGRYHRAAPLGSPSQIPIFLSMNPSNRPENDPDVDLRDRLADAIAAEA